MKLGEWWRRFVFSIRHKDLDRELAEEMQLHLELKAHKNIAAGMPSEEAYFAAHRQLGNLTRLQEESRQRRGFPFLESLAQDVRYGMRGLRKAPGFAMVAAITLALGIGASTAIFSVVNTVMLRPLPYKDSARLARIYSIVPAFPDFQLGVSNPDFNDIQSSVHSLEAAAIFQGREMNLTAPGEPEQMQVAAVSTGFLPLFGIAPAIGREFRAEDAQEKDGDVVLLSHRIWRERFASDQNIAGRTITLEQKPYTVIGVMPASYDCPNKDTDLWVPLTFTGTEATTRDNWFYGLTARTRPGQSEQSVQAELNNLADRLAAQYPKEDAGIRFKLVPLQEQVVGNSKSSLILLLGAVGFLLLIACANVSNLILSRGMQRQSEIAVRAALGASRARILRQLLVESLLLSFIGGAFGILIAIYGLHAYRVLAPANMPRINELHLDTAIAWIALAISSLAGILCGLAPALHTSRADLNLSLKERTSSSMAGTPSRFSLRGALVVVEVALALVMLDGSTLMVQSMLRLMRVNTGFRTDNVLTAELTLPKDHYSAEDKQSIFTQQLLDVFHSHERLKNIALSDSPALNHSLQMTTFDPATIGLNDKSTTLQERSVAPGFFETLGIQLISGRLFQASDHEGTTRVAIINQSLARRYFADKNPLGKILQFGAKPEDRYEIVGIVSDTRDVGLNAPPRPQVYLSLLQHPTRSIHLFIRTSGEPASLSPELRSVVWSIDKNQPVNHVQSMTQVISESVAGERFHTSLLGVFAFAGLTLTLVGIYGMVSYTAGQRTREIGIRVALGAQRNSVLRLVLGQSVRLTVLGAV
ncbi:MAG TPA: ABC transporter permease, partial [Candidatus Angelobacter sp.]|nr:ABC transporter permease [Candidatus Angelobacter sp.]